MGGPHTLPGLCGVSVSLLLSMFNYVFFGLFPNLLFLDGLASCLSLPDCLHLCLVPPGVPYPTNPSSLPCNGFSCVILGVSSYAHFLVHWILVLLEFLMKFGLYQPPINTHLLWNILPGVFCIWVCHIHTIIYTTMTLSSSCATYWQVIT